LTPRRLLIGPQPTSENQTRSDLNDTGDDDAPAGGNGKIRDAIDARGHEQKGNAAQSEHRPNDGKNRADAFKGNA